MNEIQIPWEAIDYGILLLIVGALMGVVFLGILFLIWLDKHK